MAWKDTGKSGVRTRYFAVTYSPAEVREHFDAMRDLILRGVFNQSFSQGPEEEGDGTWMNFLIAEDEADAYVRRIQAAR